MSENKNEIKRCPKRGSARIDSDMDDVPDELERFTIYYWCEDCGYEWEEYMDCPDWWWEEEEEQK